MGLIQSAAGIFIKRVQGVSLTFLTFETNVRIPNTFWLCKHGFKSVSFLSYKLLLRSEKCFDIIQGLWLSETCTRNIGLKMFICLSFAFLCMTQRQKQTLNMRMQSPNSLILGSTWQCTLGKLLFKMYLGGSLTICTYLYTSQKAILSLMSFFQKWPEMRKLYHISIFYIYSVICNGMKNFRFFIQIFSMSKKAL